MLATHSLVAAIGSSNSNNREKEAPNIEGLERRVSG